MDLYRILLRLKDSVTHSLDDRHNQKQTKHRLHPEHPFWQNAINGDPRAKHAKDHSAVALAHWSVVTAA